MPLQFYQFWKIPLLFNYLKWCHYNLTYIFEISHYLPLWWTYKIFWTKISSSCSLISFLSLHLERMYRSTWCQWMAELMMAWTSARRLTWSGNIIEQDLEALQRQERELSSTGDEEEKRHLRRSSPPPSDSPSQCSHVPPLPLPNLWGLGFSPSHSRMPQPPARST